MTVGIVGGDFAGPTELGPISASDRPAQTGPNKKTLPFAEAMPTDAERQKLLDARTQYLNPANDTFSLAHFVDIIVKVLPEENADQREWKAHADELTEVLHENNLTDGFPPVSLFSKVF